MSSRLPTPVIAQAIVAVVALILLGLWPPQRGAMLLIPLSGRAAQPINAALAGHAALLGRGPVPGSVIVFGDRVRVAAAIGAEAILVTAAPSAGCGNFADGIAS